MGRIIIALILNIFAAVSMAAIMLFRAVRLKREKRQRDYRNTFRYFTTDSNVYAASVSAAMAVFEIRYICTGAHIPKWILLLKYSAASAVLITFLTVLIFLGPTQGGYRAFYEGRGIYTHLLGPAAVIVSFVFCEKGIVFNAWKVLFSTFPVLLYGAVYYKKAVFVSDKNAYWHDFYGFNSGGRWLLSAILMIMAAVLSGIVIALANAYC